MKINPSQYETFKEYIDDMPSGINTWISDRTGISKMTLTRIYMGTAKPYTHTIEKICEVTGLTPKAFNGFCYVSNDK